MNPFLHYVYMVALAVVLLLTACSSNSRATKAAELGRKDAMDLVEMYHSKTDELRLQHAILNVRARENKFLAAGMQKEARNYEDAFKSTLNEEDSELYQLIFPEGH